MILVPDTERHKTKTGLTIDVRPLRADDTPILLEIFENLSEDSRYSRFQQSLEQVEPERLWHEAEQILDTTLRDGFALLAFTDRPWLENQAVGAARYVRNASGEAEVAITVIDEMQGQGIGSILLKLLIDHARQEGVHRLMGVAMNNNPRVWALVRSLPYRVTRQIEGTYTIVAIDLDDTAHDGRLDAADLKR
jgi:acetyltransferase